MRRTALLFAGLALMGTAGFGGDGNVRRSERRIPGQYIVVLQEGADPVTMASAVRGLKGARIRHTYGRGFKGFAVDLGEPEALRLAADPRVRFVEEDATLSATSWGLDRVDQRSLPLNNSYVSDASGTGVVLYVVDTGILTDHDDFEGRVATGFNAFDDNRGTADCNGHGTHVAGIAGGSRHGIAKSVTLVPVRVLDCNGTGSVSTLLAGLEWVQSQPARPAVVNMSLGGEASSALDDAVDRLVVAGFTTVVAAGNNNADACRKSPARVHSALTVGASTETDQRASFSNYGTCLDLFAPGTNILSAWYSSPTSTAVASGTSASAPFVAGVAALVLQKYPDASPAAVSQTILTQATVDVLGAVGEGSPNRLLYSLVGSLDETSSSDEQLLADPGYEHGTTFWSSDICSPNNPSGCSGDSMNTYGHSLPSRSGSSHAAMGGTARSFHLLSETVTIPSTVSRAELSVYLWVVTKEKKPRADDVLNVEIRDRDGRLLETVGTYSNLDASPTFLRRRFDVTRYRGIPIRISFTAVQSQGPPTWFLLDDAGLNVWR